MKKIKIIIVIIASIYFWQTYADCPIENTPEVLEKYITNVNKVISNISAIWYDSQKEKWVKKDAIYRSKKSLAILNELTDFKWYFSYFDYYVNYATVNEYVPEVWRDYEKINKISKNLERYMKLAISRWISWWVITREKICDWITENCNFEWKDIYEVIWKVINNNEKMLELYRLSITWKWQYFTNEDRINLSLIDKNSFFDEFKNYYNDTTTNKCSQKEWGFSDRISKAIESISNWQDLWKNWTKDWVYRAWLLKWDRYIWNLKTEEAERKLLQKELSRQWLSTSASEKMLKNLEKFNDSWWFSADNNFLQNTASYVYDRTSDQFGDFKETIKDSFKDKSWKEVSNIPIKKLTEVGDKVASKEQIEKEIKGLYYKELEYIKMIDTTTESLEWRIIEMHINLTFANDALQKLIPLSEKVCNDQWTNVKANCTTDN